MRKSFDELSIRKNGKSLYFPARIGQIYMQKEMVWDLPFLKRIFRDGYSVELTESKREEHERGRRRRAAERIEQSRAGAAAFAIRDHRSTESFTAANSTASPDADGLLQQLLFGFAALSGTRNVSREFPRQDGALLENFFFLLTYSSNHFIDLPAKRKRIGISYYVEIFDHK